MPTNPKRDIRPDFAEPWHRDALRARYDYYTQITGAEAGLILGWSRDRLRTHHKNHPGKKPIKLSKETKGQWNHYYLGEVLDVLDDEVLYQLKQRHDDRTLSEVQKANRARGRQREKEVERITGASEKWFKRANFSQWVALGTATHEWPVMQRSTGHIEDLFESLGTMRRGDRVFWISLADYLDYLCDKLVIAEDAVND